VIGAGAYAFLISPCLAHHFRGAYSITVGFGMDAVCCGILIINAQQTGILNRALSWGPLCVLGTWSYSLYLWQQLFLTRYVKPWTGGPLWALSAIFACALLSHYLVEKPVLRMKNQFQRL
jgi:peptidoglycan/LPS O-acetylase OafA/YrhL